MKVKALIEKLQKLESAEDCEVFVIIRNGVNLDPLFITTDRSDVYVSAIDLVGRCVVFDTANEVIEAARIPPCDLCGRVQVVSGAVLWSAPNTMGLCAKSHVCILCYSRIIMFGPASSAFCGTGGLGTPWKPGEPDGCGEPVFFDRLFPDVRHTAIRCVDCFAVFCVECAKLHFSTGQGAVVMAARAMTDRWKRGRLGGERADVLERKLEQAVDGICGRPR